MSIHYSIMRVQSTTTRSRKVRRSKVGASSSSPSPSSSPTPSSSSDSPDERFAKLSYLERSSVQALVLLYQRRVHELEKAVNSLENGGGGLDSTSDSDSTIRKPVPRRSTSTKRLTNQGIRSALSDESSCKDALNALNRGLVTLRPLTPKQIDKLCPRKERPPPQYSAVLKNSSTLAVEEEPVFEPTNQFQKACETLAAQLRIPPANVPAYVLCPEPKACDTRPLPAEENSVPAYVLCPPKESVAPPLLLVPLCPEIGQLVRGPQYDSNKAHYPLYTDRPPVLIVRSDTQVPMQTMPSQPPVQPVQPLMHPPQMSPQMSPPPPIPMPSTMPPPMQMPPVPGSFNSNPMIKPESLNPEAMRTLTDCVLYDASALHNITHIIDIDGFYVNKHFYPKEICLLGVDNDDALRIDVRLPMSFNDLTHKQRSQVCYVTKFVHGLYWTNDIDMSGFKAERMLYDAKNIPTIIRAALRDYADRRRSFLEPDPQVLVAYKGGTLERNILVAAGIPCIDLEVYGCPRFETLIQHNMPLPNSMARIFSNPQVRFECDNHGRRPESSPGSPEWWWGNALEVGEDNLSQRRRHRVRIWHCPVEECRAFASWLRSVRRDTKHTK